ncbi:MAG: DegT/DnrJ/EryC1/StrS family aminotransferase [Eisenbergiella sp.]
MAPLGKNVDEFENELAAYVGSKHAAALSAGTAFASCSQAGRNRARGCGAFIFSYICRNL